MNRYENLLNDNDLEIRLSINNEQDNMLIYEPMIYSDTDYISKNADEFLELLLKDTSKCTSKCTTKSNTKTNTKDTLIESSINNDNGYDSETDSIYSEKDVTVNPLYITSDINNKEMYNKPPRASVSIRQIWKQAGLGEIATLYQIEQHLINWANNYATITIKDNTIKEISWKCEKTKTLYTTSWKVFIKFIICGCMHHYSQ